jgi:hypothetical protein
LDERRFRGDLYQLATKACAEDDQDVRSKVFGIADVLVKLYKKNLVKINHSALELVCARELIRQGYDVKVECRLDKTLVCDVMGTRGDGRLLVEIETGFIPPEAALEPSAFARGRIASKVARYSRFADRFALGTTPSYLLDLPEFFVRPPRLRTREEAAEIKALTDVRYNKPPITINELMQAKVHWVFVIDVDIRSAWNVDPKDYLAAALAFLDRGRAAAPASRSGTPSGGSKQIQQASWKLAGEEDDL